MSFSNPEEFFSKEIRDIDFGECLKSLPCQHDNIKVTYINGEVKRFCLDGDEMRELAIKSGNKDFEYMLLH
jgi:hypothetical protein